MAGAPAPQIHRHKYDCLSEKYELISPKLLSLKVKRNVHILPNKMFLNTKEKFCTEDVWKQRSILAKVLYSGI